GDVTDRDALAVHDEVAAVDLHLAGKAPVRAVVAREMGKGLEIGQSVEGDDAQAGAGVALVAGPQHAAAEAAQPVDGGSVTHASRTPSSSSPAGPAPTSSHGRGLASSGRQETPARSPAWPCAASGRQQSWRPTSPH